LRTLEGARRGGVFFLVWGRSASELAERLTESKAAGLIGAGDVVVKATWGGVNGSPPSRWIAEREWPCEHAETLLRMVEGVAVKSKNTAGKQMASRSARGPAAETKLRTMSDAGLIALALGERFAG
jgi:hypothetical protein